MALITCQAVGIDGKMSAVKLNSISEDGTMHLVGVVGDVGPGRLCQGITGSSRFFFPTWLRQAICSLLNVYKNSFSLKDLRRCRSGKHYNISEHLFHPISDSTKTSFCCISNMINTFFVFNLYFFPPYGRLNSFFLLSY